MALGTIPDSLKTAIREHFLFQLKGQHPLDLYELELFSWFRKETENTWSHMDSEERNYLQIQVSAEIEEINESGIIATEYYRKRMRYSHVTFLTSLLENAMKRECDRLSMALGDKILFKLSELKGDPWSSRKLFLEKYGCFATPPNLWDPIQNLTFVRNVLVHENGQPSQQKTIHPIKKIADIKIVNHEIDIGVEFLEQSTESVKSFLEFIHQRINHIVDCEIRSTTLK